MAARRKTRAEDRSSIRFVVEPSLQLIFGAPLKGTFDSERGLVDYALRFINGEESPVEPNSLEASTRPAVLASMRQDLRAALRQFVAAFRSNRAAALGSAPAHLLASNRVLMTAEWEPVPRLNFYVPVESPAAFQALFALMLADDSRPFGRALCKCRLKGCGRFFLEQKPATGRPQRLYCSREHMLAAHAARER